MDDIANLPADFKQDVDDSVGIIQLICGEVNHRPFWAYVSMFPSTYMEYIQKVEAHEKVNVEEYGVVIDTGWEAYPPQEVQDRMKKDFGADNNLQAELNKIAEDFSEQERRNAN